MIFQLLMCVFTAQKTNDKDYAIVQFLRHLSMHCTCRLADFAFAADFCGTFLFFVILLFGMVKFLYRAASESSSATLACVSCFRCFGETTMEKWVTRPMAAGIFEILTRHSGLCLADSPIAIHCSEENFRKKVHFFAP
jgi:hypothetical protein